MPSDRAKALRGPAGDKPLPYAAVLGARARLWEDYALLDSGDRAKLERVGPYRIVRPELRAIWPRALPRREWEGADAIFHTRADPNRGHWDRQRDVPERWPIRYGGLHFWAQLTPFRHVGFFPEQAPQWDWIAHQIEEAAGDSDRKEPVRVLNLFAYTGIATLAAAAAGAHVTHVDASRKTVVWARENQRLSGLDDRPVRWIVDDALEFARREARRGRRYDGFILDPPPFGHGRNGELWKLDRSLPDLLAACRSLCSDRARFVALTAYATSVTPTELQAALSAAMRGLGGRLEAGQSTLIEESAGRVLPCAYFVRWCAER